MEPVSIIIPVFNGEQRLPRLLASLREQDYDSSLLDIVVVDDRSTDRSAEIARSFGCRVLTNGEKNPERGKSVGIGAARHDLLLFIDDDNHLPHAQWLRKLVDAFLANPFAVGAQSAWFTYGREDGSASRYCCLYGVIDPLVYYMRRQDHLRYIDRTWVLSGEMRQERDAYWLVHFEPDSVPTIGSQGFLTRKSTVERISWSPYFFHIDASFELAKAGYSDYVILKDSVGHEFGTSTSHLLSKIRRNIRQFSRDTDIRSYRYETNILKLAWALLQMLTVILPMCTALRTYFKTRDTASFIHPYISLITAVTYLVLTPLALLRRRPNRALSVTEH